MVSTVAEYKVSSIVYATDKQDKKEIKGATPSTIASKQNERRENKPKPKPPPRKPLD